MYHNIYVFRAHAHSDDQACVRIKWNLRNYVHAPSEQTRLTLALILSEICLDYTPPFPTRTGQFVYWVVWSLWVWFYTIVIEHFMWYLHVHNWYSPKGQHMVKLKKANRTSRSLKHPQLVGHDSVFNPKFHRNTQTLSPKDGKPIETILVQWGIQE